MGSVFFQVGSIERKWKYEKSINEKERETWKVQCGISQWKVQYIVYYKNMEIEYEFADARINCFT